MPHYLKSAPTKSFVDTAQDEVQTAVRTVIADIRDRGEAAVRDYAEKFDHWSPASFRLTPSRSARSSPRCHSR